MRTQLRNLNNADLELGHLFNSRLGVRNCFKIFSGIGTYQAREKS